jgi:glycerol-3-phosphate acyltransferase PlsX
MITIALDAGGADLGPREVAAGAERAAARGIRVLLFGPAREIGPVGEGVEVIDAPLSIAKAPDPAAAVRRHPDSSIAQAAAAVAAGRAQALVSGGSTGSALAAALFNIKRDRGIYRPALALPVPRPGELPVLLLDVGANVNCRPEHLVQFAHMGAAFAEAVLEIEQPRVALLSNGEESAKGTAEVVEAHARLAGEAGAGLNFIGNVEGTDLLGRRADVVVMDGFTGNVALKAIEGASARTLRALDDLAARSRPATLGRWLMAPALSALRRAADPEASGGAYMLGLRQLGVVAHGRFTRLGFARAIEVAARGVEEEVVARTREGLSRAGALRPTPGDEADTVVRERSDEAPPGGLAKPSAGGLAKPSAGVFAETPAGGLANAPGAPGASEPSGAGATVLLP